MKNRSFTFLLSLLLVFTLLIGCGAAQQEAPAAASSTAAAESAAEESKPAENETPSPTPETAEPTPAPVEKTGDIMILYTSDVHCGIDQGFGYTGLQAVRDSLENKGYTTLLVDNGDAIQGEAVGSFTKGSAIIEIMNALKYDVAIPGNHEFDYGMDRFLELVELADFPYISCNFNYQDKPLFDPYLIKEVCGVKIGFVGVTTPKTLTSSTPAYFTDETGKFVYDFSQDETGEKLYTAVQNSVDAARAEGADYVYLLAHCGLEAECAPWMYTDIISNTSGIDVVLDGHSHDTEQVVMKNKNGEDVIRSACGTKLQCIGWSEITADGKVTAGIYSWPNDTSAPELLGFSNSIGDKIDAVNAELNDVLNEKAGSSEVELTISDPVEKNSAGAPVRMIRRAETNLGDLVADAYLAATDADIAVANGGGIRTSIPAGEITKGQILSVNPFGNTLCVIEVTGQQLLDALEWGVHGIPGEFGGFLHVSGISYEVRTDIDSPCLTDENSLMSGISDGERRVKNVMIGNEPIDPEKTYKLAGTNYTLLENGDGYTAFNGASVLRENVSADYQALIDYITDTLGGTVGSAYSDPYGSGRITILE